MRENTPGLPVLLTVRRGEISAGAGGGFRCAGTRRRFVVCPHRAAMPSPLRAQAQTRCTVAAGRAAHGSCHAVTSQRSAAAVLYPAAEVNAAAADSLVLTSFTARRNYKSFSLGGPDSGIVNMRHLRCVKSHLCFSGRENTAHTAGAKSRNS